MSEKSIAKAQLEDVKERIHAEDMRDKTEFDGHRRLIESAIISSNGAADKIGAMAETQGQLVAFIVTQSVREPDRLAKAFKDAHMCPVAALTTFDKEGNPVYPWQASNRDGRDVVHEAWDANGRGMSGDGWGKLKGVLLDNTRLIIICVTVIISALATRTLPSITDIVKAFVPVQTTNVDLDTGTSTKN